MTTDSKSEGQVKQPSEAELQEAVKVAANKGDFEQVAALMKQLGAIKAAKEQERLKLVVAKQEDLNKRILTTITPVMKPFEHEIIEVGGIARIIWQLSGDAPLRDVKCGTATTRPASSGNGGSGRAGRVSEKYGRPLDTIFREFASPEQLAEVDRLSAMGRTDRADSKAYAIKARVVAEAEKAGLIKPIG